MRERIIIVKDGTKGRRYGETVRFELTGDADHDIARAVKIEYPCVDCDCDIWEALEEAYARIAAKLFYGAMETPVLDRVFSHYGIGSTESCPIKSPAANEGRDA